MIKKLVGLFSAVYLLSVIAGAVYAGGGSGVVQVGSVASGHLAVWAGVNQIEDGGAIPASGVTSINTLSGAVTLAAGTNMSITPSGNTLTFAASGGGSGITSGTWASRPVSPATGQFYFATDLGTGVLVVYNGTNWKPSSGRATLANAFINENCTSSTETNLYTYTLQTGLLSATGYLDMNQIATDSAIGNTGANLILRYSNVNGDTTGGSAAVFTVNGASANFYTVNYWLFADSTTSDQQIGGNSFTSSNMSGTVPVQYTVWGENSTYNTTSTATYLNFNCTTGGGHTIYVPQIRIDWVEN